MDFDAVVKKLGGFGKFQKRLLVILMVPPFLDAITTSIVVFITGHQAFRCQNPDRSDDFYGDTNFSSTTNVSECFVTTNGTIRACTKWVYDTSELSSSLLSTFDMVCDNKFVRSHMLLCHYLGVFFGSLTYGLLCDTVGRRPVLSMSLFLMFLCNLIRSWSYNVVLSGLLMLGNGWFGVTLYTSNYILATELIEPSKRLIVNFGLYLSFCIGELVLLLLAYIFRDWRELGMVSSVLVGLGHLVLLAICLIPIYIITCSPSFIVESPRWLMAKNKTKEAMAVFQKIAKKNDIVSSEDKIDIKVVKSEDAAFCTAMKQIFRSKILLVRGVILCFNWFAVNMTYYGISFKVGNLGGNIYLNFLISTIAEIIAMFICLFFNNWTGRKKTFTVSIWICGLSCLCTIFTSLYASRDYHWITIGLAMVGKLFISVGFFNAYLMSAENFPTVLRTTAMGICSAAGRIGSMVSAYIGDLGVLIDTQFGVALPLIIFGAVAVSSGFISFFLPETKDVSLPQLVEDAVTLNRKQKFNGSEKGDNEGPDTNLQHLLATKSRDIMP